MSLYLRNSYTLPGKERTLEGFGNLPCGRATFSINADVDGALPHFLLCLSMLALRITLDENGKAKPVYTIGHKHLNSKARRNIARALANAGKPPDIDAYTNSASPRVMAFSVSGPIVSIEDLRDNLIDNGLLVSYNACEGTIPRTNQGASSQDAADNARRKRMTLRRQAANESAMVDSRWYPPIKQAAY